MRNRGHAMAAPRMGAAAMNLGEIGGCGGTDEAEGKRLSSPDPPQ